MYKYHRSPLRQVWDAVTSGVCENNNLSGKTNGARARPLIFHCPIHQG